MPKSKNIRISKNRIAVFGLLTGLLTATATDAPTRGILPNFELTTFPRGVAECVNCTSEASASQRQEIAAPILASQLPYVGADLSTLYYSTWNGHKVGYSRSPMVHESADLVRNFEHYFAPPVASSIPGTLQFKAGTRNIMNGLQYNWSF